MAAQRQEELPQCDLPQLAARIQCGADDVRHYHGEAPCCLRLLIPILSPDICFYIVHVRFGGGQVSVAKGRMG